MRKRVLVRILSVIMAITLITTAIFVKGEVVTQAGEQETVTEISPGATSHIFIDSGGTYILKGGEYDIDQSEIYINTTEPVTLRLDGNITLNGDGVFIRVVKPNNKVIIDGKKYKIESKDDRTCIFYNEAEANVIFQGGTYETRAEAIPMICNSENGMISVYDAVFKGIGEKSAGLIFSNYNSTLNIYSGSIESGKANDVFCIAGGTVNIYGGTITTGMSYASAIRAEKVNFTGGKIINSRTGIDMYNGELTIGDKAIFENNSKDISLHDKDKIHILQKGDIYTDSEGKAHKVTKDWENTAKVYVCYLMDYNIKYPITMSGISETMLDHLIPLNQYYTIRYDKENQYYYLWRHVHTWDYSTEDQVIIANCTSDPDCDYEGGITATLVADDVVYDEDGLDSLVTIENDISDITGEKAILLYVGRDGTQYEESEKEPTDAGKYTAKLSIAGNTVCADFEIFKAERDAPDLTSKNETIFGKCDGKINGVNSDMEYRMQDTDYQTIKESSLSDLKPGTYYVRYKGTKNYEPSEETKIVIKEGNKIPVITKNDLTGIKKNPTVVKKMTDMGLKIKQSAKQIKVSYNKVPNASGYDIYIQYCQYKFNKKSLVSVKNANTTSTVIKKINGKKINPKQNYKIYVVAYQKINGKKKPIIKSITAHIAGRKNKKKTNVKAIKVSKATYQLKKGQSVKIKAKAVLQNKKKKQLGNDHAKQFRYVTSDAKVATVTKSGKIKALTSGTCDIYVYARNGCTKKIKVTVK